MTAGRLFEVPMSKPVSQADEPTLFPREWVIGRAAAGLVRDDEGVLLDQPWIDPLAVAPSRTGSGGPPAASSALAPQTQLVDSVGAEAAGTAAKAPPLARPGLVPAGAPIPAAGEGARRRASRPTAAEIDELKAGQARLQRRFEAARMRPRPRYIGVADRPAAVGQALVASASARVVRRRPFPWRRLAIALVLAVLASGLYQYRAVLLQL
jgi:hypothetical protein